LSYHLQALIDDLEGKASEFEDQIEELAYIASENKDDVLYLYDGIQKALGFTKPGDIINSLQELLDVELKAVEDRNREEQRKVELR
jgi:hypothetical protein